MSAETVAVIVMATFAHFICGALVACIYDPQRIALRRLIFVGGLFSVVAFVAIACWISARYAWTGKE